MNSPAATPPPGPPPDSPWKAWLADTQRELFGNLPEHFRDAIVSAALAVLSIVTVPLTSVAKREAETRPWQTLWVALPAAVVLWLLMRLASRTGYRPRGVALALLFVVGPISSAVSASRLLDSPRQYTVGHESILRPHRQARFGDWHYATAVRPPRDPRIVIVMIPYADNAIVRRIQVTRLLRKLLDTDVQGVALDIAFDLAESTVVDAGLVQCLADYEARKVPVLVGNTAYVDSLGDLRRPPMTARIAAVIPPADRGHVTAYAESDGRVRSLPALLLGHPALPALSWLVASRIEGKPLEKFDKPRDGLVQFLPPAPDFRSIREGELYAEDPTARDLVREQFVMVGEESRRDNWPTPFGSESGVRIQAWAANTWLTGRFVQRNQWWVTLVVMWASLYWLATLASQRKSRWILFAWGVALVFGCLAFAAAAMATSLFWIDVSYAILPIVTYTLLMVLFNPLQVEPQRPR